MLNVDLIRVFLQNTQRLGIIDAVILDLPRSERYKEEDVMGLRVIPGASEPKLYLNSHISNQLSFPVRVFLCTGESINCDCIVQSNPFNDASISRLFKSSSITMIALYWGPCGES